MLKLRLSRGGTKKRPVYKVVVADSRFARDGRFIEKVGFFNPLLPKEKKERVGLEADWGLSGATTTTSPISFITEIRVLIPGADIPSSFVTNIKGFFAILGIIIGQK